MTANNKTIYFSNWDDFVEKAHNHEIKIKNGDTITVKAGIYGRPKHYPTNLMIQNHKASRFGAS